MDTKKEKVGVVFYLRRRRISAAAATMMIMIAKPIAMYVAVGAEVVGGITTGLGVAKIVGDGVAVGA